MTKDKDHTVVAKDRSDPHTSEGGTGELTVEDVEYWRTQLLKLEWSNPKMDIPLINALCDMARRSAPAAGMDYQNPATQVMFRAGLLACREYMARFIEAQDQIMAQSIRANWWPSLGDDPGAPRKLAWNEVADGDEPGKISVKQISPSVEALPVALQFLLTREAK